MSKETRALTTIGGKVQETKSVPVNSKTTASKSTAGNSERSSKKGADGKTSTSKTATTPHEQIVPVQRSWKKVSLLSFVAAAVIGILATIATFTYRSYILDAKNTEIVDQNSDSPTRQISSSYSDEELASIASQENIGLPRMVDKDTRLDFTVGVSDTFEYNYTLINNNSKDISFASLSTAVEKSLVKWVCTTKSNLDRFVTKGVTVSFAYFGKDKQLIGVISVEPSQCADFHE